MPSTQALKSSKNTLPRHRVHGRDTDSGLVNPLWKEMAATRQVNSAGVSLRFRLDDNSWYRDRPLHTMKAEMVRSHVWEEERAGRMRGEVSA